MTSSISFGEVSQRSSLVRVAATLLLLLVCSFTAAGQTFSASITGTATDSSGAVVSGAKVQLKNTDTKDVRDKTTGSNGSYDFQNLLPGTYQLSVMANGFKDAVKTGLILRANTAASVNSVLQVGNAQEQVVVSADTVLVDTETPNNSVTMDNVLIENLPNNTRNPLNFVFDLAGTTESGETSRSTTFDQQASAFGINGGRSGESEILIDGAPSTALDWGGLMVSPIQDSVQEQQVALNEYDAQYDRGGEGVVTLVTKNGSDHFHGVVYDYFRNSGLDANAWSNKNTPDPTQVVNRPKFHQNQFGANLGGPVWRSKHLYFFAGYEGLRQPGSTGLQQYTVPTDLERQGDFSQSFQPNGTPVTVYNPFTTRQVTDAMGNTYYTRDPYPGNKITGNFDPVGLKILSLYPEPNTAGDGPAHENNFSASAGNNTSNDKFDWRLDWAQSPKHRIFARMSDRVRENQTPGCIFCNGADENSGNDDHAFQVAINDTLTPTQNWVIDIYGAYSRWWEGQQVVGLGVANLSNIGLSPSLSQAPLLPIVNAGQYSELGNPYSSFDRYIRYSSTGILNITRELHSHTLKFGFNYDVGMINIRNDTPPTFNFSQDQTACYAGPAGGPCQVLLNQGTSGQPIASMLLGVGSGGITNFGFDPAESQHAFGMYLQDNWRATQRLTVYAGLRYENQRPATERHNRAAYFDPKLVNSISSAAGSPVMGGFEYVGVDGRSRSEWQPDNLNFSPRLGLAYKLTDRFVVRAGSGIYYTPTSAMLGYDGGGQGPGYTAQTNWNATQFNQGYVPGDLVSNPFPNGLVQPTGNALGDQAWIGHGQGQVWLKGPHPVGSLYQWSTDFQYQVSPHSVAELGYTGVRGRRLLYGNPNLDFNQMPDADLAVGPSLNDEVPNPLYGVLTDPNGYESGPTVPRNFLLRPYPAFVYLQLTRSTPGARSQFDALYAKYNHSFSGGLSSITTYQWSKNLDDGSEARLGWTGVDAWRDYYHTKLDYSLSAHDAPQSFAEALVYQLPYGPGRHWGNSAPQFVKQTLGGWNTSAAIHLGSGYPLSQPVTFAYNPLGNFGFPGGGIPDVVGNPQPSNRNSKHWINSAAFTGVNSAGGASLRCDQFETITNPDGSTYSSGCQPFPLRYGNEPNHMTQLRDSNQNNLDMGLGKQFGGERFHTEFRADFLNVFNHPIYSGNAIDVSVGDIGAPGQPGDFGRVFGTRNDPREIQLSLKISY